MVKQIGNKIKIYIMKDDSMNGESKIDDILRRIDELIGILKIISDDLAEISKSLKATVTLKEIPEVTPLTQTRQMQTINDVQKIFPRDLAGMLYFEETDEYILIRPRQYLGPENFAKIASIVRDQLGGEYVSAGRESHFRIPRKT